MLREIIIQRGRDMDNLLELYFKEILTQDKELKDEKTINETFKVLNAKAEIVYDFILAYYDKMYIKKDYGTNEVFSMLEAHILTDIVDGDGITVTELAKKWKRTTSFISQIIRNFLKNEYIYRVNSKEDAKVFYLYPYEKAKEFALLHKKFDIEQIKKLDLILAEKFSVDELIIFNKILKEYANFLLNNKFKTQ